MCPDNLRAAMLNADGQSRYASCTRSNNKSRAGVAYGGQESGRHDGIGSNVTALQLAVGGRRGTVAFHAARNALFSSMYSSVNGRAVEGADQQVEATTLDAIMARFGLPRCDYLKLDCEGAEHDIIGAMLPTTAEPADAALHNPTLIASERSTPPDRRRVHPQCERFGRCVCVRCIPSL